MYRWVTIGLWAGLGLVASTGDAAAQIGKLLGADPEPGEPATPSVPWVNAPPEVRAAAVADLVVLSQNPLNTGLVMLAAGRGDGEDHLGRQEPTWDIDSSAALAAATPVLAPANQPGGQGGQGGGQGGGSNGSGGGGGTAPAAGPTAGTVWVAGLLPPEGSGPLPAIAGQPGGSPQLGNPPFALGLVDDPPEPGPPPAGPPVTTGPDADPPEPGPPQLGEPPDPVDMPQTPEPGTLVLAGLGLTVIGFRRLRRAGPNSD